MIRILSVLLGLVLATSTGVLMFVRRQTPSPAYLVFVSEGGQDDGVYRMYSDGSGQQRLTNFPSRLFAQATFRQMKPIFTPFSPDQTWMSFSLYRNGNFDIYKVNQEGTEIQLTRRPSLDMSPAWSPDGAWIAFVSKEAGDFDIFKMRSDGSELRRLTDSPRNELSPAWLPAVDLPWAGWINLAASMLLITTPFIRRWQRYRAATPAESFPAGARRWLRLLHARAATDTPPDDR